MGRNGDRSPFFMSKVVFSEAINNALVKACYKPTVKMVNTRVRVLCKENIRNYILHMDRKHVYVIFVVKDLTIYIIIDMIHNPE